MVVMDYCFIFHIASKLRYSSFIQCEAKRTHDDEYDFFPLIVFVSVLLEGAYQFLKIGYEYIKSKEEK